MSTTICSRSCTSEHDERSAHRAPVTAGASGSENVKTRLLCNLQGAAACADGAGAGAPLHTGDIAEVDADGYYRIVGRKKELIITTSGKNMSPVNIESMLQEQPLVAQCCVIGDGRDHLTALIVLEPTLSTRPDAADEVARHVAIVNERLSAAEQIVAFTIMPAEWTVAGEELTPTLKIRRATIEQKYAETIRAMYP